MKKVMWVLIALFAVFVGFYLYYDNRWQYLWALEEEHKAYDVAHHDDDTLRVAMIGDSWVGLRTKEANDRIGRQLSQLTGRHVVVNTKGKGGERSRGIYQLMFEDGEYGTRSLIADGPDFCVVFAGINDAGANLGTKQFCHHYGMILHHLLQCNIRPVVVEIPDVDIWTLYKHKPIKNIAGDFVKSTMTGCGMYHFREYREALNQMLTDGNCMDKVVFVPMKEWSDSPNILLDDQIHLNRNGYERMDSCIAVHIANGQ